MSRLASKVAIVMGAASGIGLGIAQLFTREGATVIFSDINNKSGKLASDAASNKKKKILYSLNVIYLIWNQSRS